MRAHTNLIVEFYAQNILQHETKDSFRTLYIFGIDLFFFSYILMKLVMTEMSRRKFLFNLQCHGIVIFFKVRSAHLLFFVTNNDFLD